ncbi:MAG TPA: transposase [Pyrinomonadaceae bacterium]|nr:transposase [Pyrinomonadaceae bacterium]
MFRYRRTDPDQWTPTLAASRHFFAAVYKTYTMVSARRFASDLRDALAKGYISKMPSYNSIFDYFQMEALTPYLKQMIVQSALLLKSIETEFDVDSSGFPTSTYVRWFDMKYGNNEDWHDWVKMHLICGVKTHVVTSVEISRATANDSPFYKPLLASTG